MDRAGAPLVPCDHPPEAENALADICGGVVVWGGRCADGTALGISCSSNRYVAQGMVLFLAAPWCGSIPIILLHARKRRQPGFPADDPAFIAGRQLIWCIEGSEMHLDLIRIAGENRGAATRTKMPSGIVSGLALNFHRALRKNGRSVEQRAMVLSTVEAMTDANPVGASQSRNSNVAADAATREALHDRAAFRSSRSNVTRDLRPRPSGRRHAQARREEQVRRYGCGTDPRPKDDGNHQLP